MSSKDQRMNLKFAGLLLIMSDYVSKYYVDGFFCDQKYSFSLGMW